MTRERVLHLTKNDFTFQAFRSGGHGGQNQNKVNSGCRVIHTASGARAESRSSRSWEENRRIAFRKLVDSARFRFWIAEQHYAWEKGRNLDEEVAAMMSDENIRVEVKRDGKWVTEPYSRMSDND